MRCFSSGQTAFRAFFTLLGSSCCGSLAGCSSQGSFPCPFLKPSAKNRSITNCSAWVRPKVLPIRAAAAAFARWGAQMSKPSEIANSKSLSIFESFISGGSVGAKARASSAVFENSKYELSVSEMVASSGQRQGLVQENEVERGNGLQWNRHSQWPQEMGP